LFEKSSREKKQQEKSFVKSFRLLFPRIAYFSLQTFSQPTPSEQQGKDNH
jgi:hypothetical protein